MRKIVLALFMLAWLPALGQTVTPISGTVTTTYNVAAHAKPTVALANLGAGLITNGTHSYKITLLDAAGESLPSSSKSSVLTTATATNGKVLVTIPAFLTNQTGANVYRTVAGDAGDYLLVNAVPIAVAGDYTDNIADGSLGAAAPTANTSGLAQAPDLTVALAGAGAGLVTTGTHSYKLQFNDAVGHSLQSNLKSNVVTTDEATNGQVTVTVPAFPAGAVSANVFRTAAGDAGNYLLVNASPILAAGAYTDNIADAALGAAVVATNTSGMAQPGAPTVALANLGAGLCADGAHLIKVAYVTANGVSTLSAASDAVTTASATNGKILVTVVASANPSVTSVNAYMTEAGGTDYYLAASGIANSNGDTTLNLADATLITQGVAPTTDTSPVDTIIYAPSPYGFDKVVIRNTHASIDAYITLDGTLVSTSTSFSVTSGCTPKCEEVFYGSKSCPIKSIHIRGNSTSAGATVAYWATGF